MFNEIKAKAPTEAAPCAHIVKLADGRLTDELSQPRDLQPPRRDPRIGLGV